MFSFCSNFGMSILFIKDISKYQLHCALTDLRPGHPR